jgi:hypothetical protein
VQFETIVKYTAIWQMGGAVSLAICAAACGGGASDQAEGGTRSDAELNDTSAAASDDAGDCVALPLAEACVASACPETPEDVVPACPDGSFYPRTTTRTATTCGGVVVAINFGLYGQSYFFDAEGRLTGVTGYGDVGPRCQDYGISTSTKYGSTCAMQGAPADLCSLTPGP